ncbi:TonB-dependent receptor [Frateuria defendens]|uniref:TonB-dependent receptor n=1 Tax=Frateuria defendens TaxID=2219559 RepID=UPI00066FC345|nr:TonB-dependent receptor [Frateuria defendens]
MKPINHPRSLRRSALAAALAIGLGSSGAVLAQSNATGVIYGHVEAAPDASVQLQNLDTGQTRTLGLDASGNYRASSLAVGRYRVTLQRGGQAVATRDNVQVALNTGTEISFTGAPAEAKTLEGMTVVASAMPAIDVSSVDSRTVLTAEQLDKLPVARSVAAAALLAPGTVEGDSRYGGAISFGGASAAENQFYVNGFPVTNPLTGLGFTELPFDSIDQQQVLTGGYGAEYGRSTGGVVNIVTKSGSNTWKMGGEVQWSPRALRDSPRSIYYKHNGTEKDGQLFQDRSRNKTWQSVYAGYISGPLVKDRLFMYLTAEKRETSGSRGVNSELVGTAADTDTKTTRWLGKINWNITDNHIVEVTGMGDTTTIDRTIRSYDYATGTKGALLGTEYLKNFDVVGAGATPGGNLYVGKYTGYLTDNLTVTALYGKTHSERVDTPLGAGGVPCPVVVDARGVTPSITGCSITAAGTVLPAGAKDDTDGWRFDVEYRLGDHDLRAGLDNVTLKSFSGTVFEGGSAYRYANTSDVDLTGYPDVNVPTPEPDYIVRNRIIGFNASVKVKQEAQYIEDHWQVTDRWLAYLGLRNEQFSNYNGSGQVYVKQRHQLAPRLGVTWDVFGDSTFKIYANAGRYHLAIPANVAIRGASASLFASQWYTFTGVDPATGVPSGLTPVTGVLYSNGADGVTAPDPRSVAAKNLQAYYQDEYILGFDKAINDRWAFGAKLTYRKLLSIIDDFCDEAPFVHYAERNNIDISNAAIQGCYLFNPGKNNTFQIDLTGNGDYRDFRLTKEDFAGNSNGIGFPDLKRKYLALDLYLLHQFSDNWYGKLEYVWSKNYGNSEGLLKSDIGQLDPSVTQDWDFPELMIGSSGYLPNDRRHQLKAYGYWQATPEWLFGANASVASGRPKNCIGNAPEGYDRQGYGTSFFFCDLNGDGIPEPTPRGSQGRLPWTWRLDLSAQYSPAWADHKLSFTVDVFNVFSQQRTLSISETAGGDPSYGRTIAYSDPRYVRLGARYDFSL